MTLFYKGGCLLPLLIIFNLFFGKLFFNTRTWLIVEGVLLLIFIIFSYIFSKNILNSVKRRNNVIDVEGEVVEDSKKLK
jgi:hypothetical protein